ncbi:MAG: UbiA family prenyltransferase [Pseudomonadota bacterium]
MSIQSSAGASDRATLNDYLRIARFDHATKHIFIVPGVALAILLRGMPEGALWLTLIVGFVSATCIASANYVINEWLDREFDKFHPEKSQRAAVQKELDRSIVYMEYAAFLVVGLLLAAAVNTTFLVVSVLFAISGVIYNVQPARSKDKAYLDVLTESLNNPLRLLLGWAMIDPGTIPPGSLLLSYWFGGAFLMNSKRLSEYRDIVASHGNEILSRYRRSFAYYDENKLSVANLVYALCCAFFLAIFLIKYRIELVLLFPCVVALFGAYYSLALQPGSVARKPENLYKTPSLVILAGLTGLVFIFAILVDMPQLEELTGQVYITLPVSGDG